MAGINLAEAAGACAALAVDHEGGGAVGPALVDVRAARLLAHGDEPEVVDGRSELAVALADAHGHPHPVRLALPDVEPLLGYHPRLAQPAQERALRLRRCTQQIGGALDDVVAIEAVRTEGRSGARHERVDHLSVGNVDALGDQRGHAAIRYATRHN